MNGNGTSTKTVVAVDDSEHIRRLMRMQLTSLGYRLYHHRAG
jgi:CheY-like chemotaxis protein